MYSLQGLQLFGSLAIPIYLNSMLTCENPYFSYACFMWSKMHISVVSGSKFMCYLQVYCFMVTLHVHTSSVTSVLVCGSLMLGQKMLYMPLLPGKHISWYTHRI